MIMPWRHRLRLLRRGAWYALALALVVVALLATVASQMLPMLQQRPQQVADWLSTRAHRKVAFDHLDTAWTRRGPLLRLRNLRVGDGPVPLAIGDAELLVSPYAGLLPGRSLTELRLRGLDLTLQRQANGQWHVRGLPGQANGGDPLDDLAHLGELQLAQARLRVLAPELGVDVRVPRIDVRLQVDGARVRAGAKAWLDAGAAPFEVAADLDRRQGNGLLYAGTGHADLSQLAGKLQFAGASLLAGQGKAQAWARLHARRVVALRAVADLEGVRLLAAAAPDQPAVPRALGTLSLDAAWAGSVQDWRARATRLRFGDGVQPQVLDGLTVAGGRHPGLWARQVQAAPLLQLASMGNVLPAGTRRWLQAAAPDALLQDVVVQGERGGALRARARISGFRFDPVGHAPGMRGVGGWLQADQDGLRLRFDNRAQVVFDWPAGFGVPHAFTLDGEVVVWRAGTGWTVQTPGLAIAGGPLQVHARGGIGFQNDGTHPHLDIAADIGDAPMAMAHGFWIHHLMPKATVAWLDAALQAGTLRNIHAVVAGDLDDWPFRNEPGMAGAGVFRADARIDNGTVKFQPEWPAAERMHADVSFVADGFTVNGSAQLAGVPVTRLQAGIARFGQAELDVDAAAAGDAASFLVMLRKSPLHKEYASTLDALRAGGLAQATFKMALPLHHDQPLPPVIDGTVALAGVRLRETRWNLDFDRVHGQARFDRGGFVAEGLQVRSEGAPGVLSLRAGPHVRDAAQAFEAQLQTQADIDALLRKAGNLDWLAPHVGGRSAWSVALTVPRAAGTATPPASLQLRSNLVGTAIDLPAPLYKPAAQPLAAEVSLRLPPEGGEISARLGDVLALRSRSSNGQTGLRVQLGGEAAGPPPARGLVVTGQVGRLDALDWISLVGGSRGGNDLPLQRIDVQAQTLRLLGTDFTAARLQMAPVGHGTAVQVQGDGIAGSLLVPAQEGALVSGRFDRLYWGVPAMALATPSALPAPVVNGALAIDPARIPPLQFDVADLRFGSVDMGSARFRSSPVPGGLRMDEFSTSGGKQRLSASGGWSGRGAAERSQLKLEVDSDNIGKLLAGLGMGGQVAGGKGRFGMQAAWRGGPDDFNPVTLDAALALDARDGHLLELEPGAGRVLGLLGVAQLRRRLTLDFSDFFSKGFAFDRIQGNARLGGGSLHTDNLTVRGPAATLLVRGDTDLRNQRFDQTVDVMPKSAGLLTAVGALAGGPVGAAVGAVANAVLDKPMRNIGAKTYHVTGPWSAPKVETIARDASVQADAKRGQGD